MSRLLQQAIQDHPHLHAFAALFDEFNDQLKKMRKLTK